VVKVVDNQLLFPANPSTFHSHPQARSFWWEIAGLNLGFRPQGVDNPVDEFLAVVLKEKGSRWRLKRLS
jgi:hypothetical protein